MNAKPDPPFIGHTHLLGWSVERAEDWASAAAHDWTTYPELRSPSRKVITLGD